MFIRKGVPLKDGKRQIHLLPDDFKRPFQHFGSIFVRVPLKTRTPRDEILFRLCGSWLFYGSTGT
jgi:hypothetical protein